ncbi:hypothetical protein M430DRAFT_153491 [Amorphotheca resinae ATCC 22711]|uniref:Uncharacterized protein n=1 Tax=Amorphotheca resinae ATCC 22711 TaxID=857342 RepID=A0A2T3BDI1_AMORE|nr:hypothetical protein M430DRAFT_153491 [Amorphotheca resinae ATCC 22711]PSS27388.1 hypothetical protein M430DRAFT_153491 [Amorphotheca resinae ATCC 22711]
MFISPLSSPRTRTPHHALEIPTLSPPCSYLICSCGYRAPFSSHPDRSASPPLFLPESQNRVGKEVKEGQYTHFVSSSLGNTAFTLPFGRQTPHQMQLHRLAHTIRQAVPARDLPRDAGTHE